MCLRQPDHTVHEARLSFAINSIFNGTLKIAIAASGQSLTTTAMNLNAGRGITSTDSEWVRSRPPNCGSTYNTLSALPSPDGMLSIPCGWIDTLVIKGSHGEDIPSPKFVPHARIRDVVWSPDSKSIAILVEESKSEFFSRQGLLSLILGLQPLQLTHYRLFLYSPKFGASEELPLPSEYIQGAWAAMERLLS
jgi:hypothetical protein